MTDEEIRTAVRAAVADGITRIQQGITRDTRRAVAFADELIECLDKGDA